MKMEEKRRMRAAYSALALGILASGLAAAPAQADPPWRRGWGPPGHYHGPGPGYYAPRPYYYPPARPVYVAPPPVYYAPPRPVYVAPPPPVYVAPAPIYAAPIVRPGIGIYFGF